VGGEFQEAGMEIDSDAATLQDHAAQVVSLQAPGRPTPVVKRMHLAQEKSLQALVEEEFQPQGTAAGEREDEPGQTPAAAEVAGPNGQSGWIGQEINGPNGPGAWTLYGSNFLRFVAPGAKADNSDPVRLFSQFDIDMDPLRMADLRPILDANDPDLSAFRRRGGKLLMYFGWADRQLNPMMAVEYYEQVMRNMGQSTGDFFRLFMVPGMFHCGGSVGTSQFDAATPLVNWVEAGKAPDRIEASRVVNSKGVRTRPLCPYPQVARYQGSGSIDEAANFTCVMP
jgi:feruloyl esterase